jgi:hypothetical protein
MTGTSWRTRFLYQPISCSNTRVTLLIMHFFITNAFSPIQIFVQSSLSVYQKKNKEEGNSLVDFRRCCYATALRDVCNLIIIDRFRSRTRTSKTTCKWRVVPMYGYATPFSRHFHVVFDVRVLDLNLSNNLRIRRAHTKRKGGSVLSI